MVCKLFNIINQFPDRSLHYYYYYGLLSRLLCNYIMYMQLIQNISLLLVAVAEKKSAEKKNRTVNIIIKIFKMTSKSPSRRTTGSDKKSPTTSTTSTKSSPSLLSTINSFPAARFNQLLGLEEVLVGIFYYVADPNAPTNPSFLDKRVSFVHAGFMITLGLCTIIVANWGIEYGSLMTMLIQLTYLTLQVVGLMMWLPLLTTDIPNITAEGRTWVYHHILWIGAGLTILFTHNTPALTNPPPPLSNTSNRVRIAKYVCQFTGTYLLLTSIAGLAAAGPHVKLLLNVTNFNARQGFAIDFRNINQVALSLLILLLSTARKWIPLQRVVLTFSSWALIAAGMIFLGEKPPGGNPTAILIHGSVIAGLGLAGYYAGLIAKD
jgi:hypothetical protein